MLAIRFGTALFLVILAQAVAADPLGTGFAFQGLIRQNGTPLNGNVDIVVDLFDADVAGNMVAPSQIFTAANGNPAVVHDGVFSLNIDFGPTAFNGPISEKRYLRLIVNGTPLAPRTAVQSAPYALQSRTSELAYFAEGVPDASIGALQIDSTAVQRRIVNACGAGSSIRSVSSDGNVTCQDDTNSGGTITGVSAGSGLTGGGTSGAVSLAVDSALLQLRVADSCAPGSSIRSIDASGSVVCQSDTNSGGTITGIVPGTGLSGGGSSGSVNLQLAPPIVLGDSQGTLLSLTNTNASSAANSAASIATTGASNFGAALTVASQTSSNTIGAGAVQGTVSGVGGTAGTFIASNPAGSGIAVYAATEGNGVALSGISNGSGAALNAIAFGSAPSVYARKPVSASGITAQFENQNPGNSSPTVLATSSGAQAVSAVSSVSSGVRGETTATGQSGVVGIASASSGLSFGVFGTSNSASGAGLFGYAASGAGVLGRSDAGNAVRGEASTASAMGVVGYNSATSGFARGVYGQSDSAGGFGVHGYSGSGSGVYGTTSSGYAGRFDGELRVNGVTNVVGGFGASQSSYFASNLQVLGTLSKSSGSFKIDHPLDPKNKFLFHSFVESPDMKNLYDGVTSLDNRGEAIVVLPAYFESLNQDFRYQLTSLGVASPSLYVADEISNSQFRIAGGVPGQRVSWMVTGTRKDAWANAHRIEVEVDKGPGERGKYLHPELFGGTQNDRIVPALGHEGAPIEEQQ
jgi:hypothetical protein